MTERHEVKKCMQLGFGDPDFLFFTEDQSTSAGRSLCLLKHQYGDKISEKLKCASSEQITVRKTIKFDGVNYTASDVLILVNNKEELPVFGRITEICIKNSKLIFICQELVTNYYDSSLHAYQISTSKNKNVYTRDNLPAKQTFPEIIYDGESFIVLINNTRVEFCG